MNPRVPLRTTRGVPTQDGAGVRLTRLLGGGGGQSFADPFLMLDYFDSPEAQDYIAGFPPHPHRGFETVTYMLAGRMRHRDNHGHEGVIETGGVQWMTAGRGIIHSEMPEQTSGRMAGFQLWVNLPARLKMQAPAYAEHPGAAMPVERRDGGTAIKVIAGETSRGTAGPIVVEATGARYFDIEFAADGRLEEPLPVGFAALVVVHAGSVSFADGTELAAVGLAELGAGDVLRLAAPKGPARVLLIAGRPLGEPVAWQGPFVMNTREELVQAFDDYRAGQF
jgi:redox-sensitive bicupin YhaK (pirin superfamily)